ncbi:MAG: GNAT family N-acetyltransferase, partial [Candidatus Puniceispirillaceae bacterium]
MTTEFSTLNRGRVTLEMADELNANDLSELCDAAEEAIKAGGGFGWLAPPPRNIMEDYWRGVLLIPERRLFVGKVDMVMAGSCQIVRPPKANEAQAFACQLTTFFLAPWARGHGLAQRLI